MSYSDVFHSLVEETGFNPRRCQRCDILIYGSQSEAEAGQAFWSQYFSPSSSGDPCGARFEQHINGDVGGLCIGCANEMQQLTGQLPIDGPEVAKRHNESPNVAGPVVAEEQMASAAKKMAVDFPNYGRLYRRGESRALMGTREHQVAAMLAHGFSGAEQIADHLGIKKKYVQACTYNLRKRFGWQTDEEIARGYQAMMKSDDLVWSPVVVSRTDYEVEEKIPVDLYPPETIQIARELMDWKRVRRGRDRDNLCRRVFTREVCSVLWRERQQNGRSWEWLAHNNGLFEIAAETLRNYMNVYVPSDLINETNNPAASEAERKHAIPDTDGYVSSGDRAGKQENDMSRRRMEDGDIVAAHRRYVTENLTLKEVAEDTVLSSDSLRHNFHRLGLPVRTRGSNVWTTDDLALVCSIHALQPDDVQMSRPDDGQDAERLPKRPRAMVAVTCAGCKRPLKPDEAIPAGVGDWRGLTLCPECAEGDPDKRTVAVVPTLSGGDLQPNAATLTPSRETAVTANGNGSRIERADDLRNQLDLIHELLSLADARQVTLHGKISVELHAEVAF